MEEGFRLKDYDFQCRRGARNIGFRRLLKSCKKPIIPIRFGGIELAKSLNLMHFAALN
jgi:hypothetical protein